MANHSRVRSQSKKDAVFVTTTPVFSTNKKVLFGLCLLGLFVLGNLLWASSCIPVSDPGLILCSDDNQCWNKYRCLPEPNQTGVLRIIKRCTPPNLTAPPVEYTTTVDANDEEDEKSRDKDSAVDNPPVQCKKDEDCPLVGKCCLSNGECMLPATHSVLCK